MEKPKHYEVLNFKRVDSLLCPAAAATDMICSCPQLCTSTPIQEAVFNFHNLFLTPQYVHSPAAGLGCGLCPECKPSGAFPTLCHAATRIKDRNSTKSLTLEASAGPPPRH